MFSNKNCALLTLLQNILTKRKTPMMEKGITVRKKQMLDSKTKMTEIMNTK